MPWELTGNAIGSTGGFLGTTDAQPLIIRTGTSPAAQPPERLRVMPDGKIGIGTAAPQARLSIAGGGAIVNNVAIGTDSANVNYPNEADTIGLGSPETSGILRLLRLQSPNGLTFHTGAPGVTPEANQRLTVTSDGRVGLGTTAPGAAYRLDVSGVLNATDYHKNGAPLVSSQWTGATGGISYTGGNAGVGTAQPLYRLHALAPGGFGPEDASGISQVGNVPIVAQANSSAIGILNANGRQAFALNIDGNGGTNTTRGVPTFFDKYDGVWHHCFSLKNGRVGVNTSNPQASLDVNGDISIWGKHALRGNDTWLRLNQDGAFTAGVHTPGVFAPVSLNVGGLGGWGNPGWGNSWFAGRVGVGTTGPGFLLDVADRIRLRQGGSGTAGLWLYQTAPARDQAFIGMRTDTSVGLWGNTGIGWGLYMDTGNGEVNIASRLGTLGWSATPRTPGWGGGIHTWDVEAEGTMWSQHGYKQGSDARTKTNVAELSGVLEKLESIRGVSFERIGTRAVRSARRDIGVIAQEVEEVFPELVSEHGEENLKAVDYSGLAGVLIEATKELKAEYRALRSRIEALELG
jgi:Chaperone of endosialidase